MATTLEYLQSAAVLTIDAQRALERGDKAAVLELIGSIREDLASAERIVVGRMTYKERMRVLSEVDRQEALAALFTQRGDAASTQKCQKRAADLRASMQTSGAI